MAVTQAISCSGACLRRASAGGSCHGVKVQPATASQPASTETRRNAQTTQWQSYRDWTLGQRACVELVLALFAAAVACRHSQQAQTIHWQVIQASNCRERACVELVLALFAAAVACRHRLALPEVTAAARGDSEGVCCSRKLSTQMSRL